ncbi:MAG: sporulation protein YabP [Clostridiales bacterium]|nr:sporulation protein YabP [Clostridiales bacterium]
MEDQKTFKTNNQNIFVENRQKISITEVQDVESFDDELIQVSTPKGKIVIKGLNLQVQKLDLEEGKVIINGSINAINYIEKEDKGKSFLGKILK